MSLRTIIYHVQDFMILDVDSKIELWRFDGDDSVEVLYSQAYVTDKGRTEAYQGACNMLPE